MIIQLQECGEPLADHLEQFKQYASVPDDSRDGILQKLLRSAMLTVQEFSDVAMLPCKIELSATNVRRGEAVKLYQGGHEVLAVADESGEPVPYTQEPGQLRIQKHCDYLTVIYRNRVIPPQAEKLLPICLELATAIYDGEDTKVQCAILKKTYGLK